MIYLMLDKNDITKVCGEVDRKQLKEELKLKESQLNLFIKNGNLYKDKYVLIEKESRENDEYVETINGKAYYVDRNCRIFHYGKNGKKVYHKSYYKRHRGFIVTYGGTQHNLGRIVAKAFIKKNLSKNDYILIENNELKLENIRVVPKNVACKNRSKRVGLYENGVLKEKFESSRECAKKLYCSCATVSFICNNKTNKKMYDLRFIE